MEEGKGEKRKEGLKQNHSANRVTQLSPFFASTFPLFPPETPDTQANLLSATQMYLDLLSQYSLHLSEIIL